ncbi:hypothetical protein CRUP_010615 [Coryphaenoides rupestris]|nr:hypothetical protein CRUP_010615 [Coryphaenoides rupestris]
MGLLELRSMTLTLDWIRPEELSTLTSTASFRCVLKPTASRSARVLGRSLGGHVYVIKRVPCVPADS